MPMIRASARTGGRGRTAAPVSCAATAAAGTESATSQLPPASATWGTPALGVAKSNCRLCAPARAAGMAGAQTRGSVNATSGSRGQRARQLLIRVLADTAPACPPTASPFVRASRGGRGLDVTGWIHHGHRVPRPRSVRGTVCANRLLPTTPRRPHQNASVTGVTKALCAV